MLNVIQLMDDEGLGHCKRMVNFSQKLQSEGSDILLLVNRGRRDQIKILNNKKINCLEYNPKFDIGEIYSLVIKNQLGKNIESWSIDTKFNCIKETQFLKDKGLYTRLFDNKTSCRLIVDENVYPTPLFDKNDLDWSNYKGKVLGGWEHVLLGAELEKLKEMTPSNDKKSCVISFGGSDPQDITLKVLKILMPFSEKIPIIAILGPKYKNKQAILKLNKITGNKIKVISDRDNIDSYLASAKLVITAVGLTIIEAIFLKVPCICISNYKSDNKDLERLKMMKNIHVFGHYKKLSGDSGRISDIVIDVFSL